MSLTEEFFPTDDLHPIDVVEHLAAHRDWDFDRITDDQIAMQVVGQWHTYSLTLAWSAKDDTLRLVCTFEMQPPTGVDAGLYELLNRINDECWCGAFTWWADQRLMVWRYGLVLGATQSASVDQVDQMIRSAIGSAERFYPAFQLVSWGGQSPQEAMKVAMAEAWGRA